MSFLDTQYHSLISHAMSQPLRGDRTQTGTRSFFHGTIRHDMREGFPAITTKRLAWHQVAVELLWFLRGKSDLRYLVDNNCNIWTGDAYANYLASEKNEDITIEEFSRRILDDPQFSDKHGNLGPIYGVQWRNWGVTDGRTGHVDQIEKVYSSLRTNPTSRRHLVSAWNVGELESMVLPPCHYSFQFYVEEIDGVKHLSLMWNQRSSDLFLGLPFNIASYGLLLSIMAHALEMKPYMLIGVLGDCHLYENHVRAAEELLGRSTSKHGYPDLYMAENGFDVLFNQRIQNPTIFKLLGYKSFDSIKAKLNN